MPPLFCFATTSPGLESILAAELTALGIAHEEPEPGGILFARAPDQLAEVLLSLRTAGRIIVRIGEFRARTFPELERHANRIDWSELLASVGRVHFRVTSKKSRLYHEGGIAERLERAAIAAVPGLEAVRSATQAEALEDDPMRLPGVQRIVVRIHRDVVTLSADASGAALHRRGYRQATAKAPLRESLAAAMLLGSGWHPESPLADPFAGSGTIAIEAALIARQIAPGLQRRFAAEQWSAAVGAGFALARTRAKMKILPHAPSTIEASDRDAGAIAATLANAERAGVHTDLRATVAPLSSMSADAGEGWIVTNPPYGVRLGDVSALRSLYAALGQTLVTRRPGWSLAWLSANPLLSGQVGVNAVARWHTTNGGLAVTLLASSEG